MTFWGLAVGFIIGFFPIMVLLRVRRFHFVSNPYLRGAIIGAMLWLLICIMLMLEARFSLLGILDGEQGFASMMILTSSLQGFITAGIAAAFMLKKIKKL